MHAHFVPRRSILRRSALLVLAAGGASILAACGGTGPAATTTAPAAQAPTSAPAAQPAPTTAPVAAAAPTAAAKAGTVTIRYYQFMNSVEDVPIWQGGIDRFNKQSPDIKIAHEQAPWGDYWDKLAATVAANSQADAILMVTMYDQQYGRLGAIQDLGPFARADKTSNLDDQWPAVKRANTIKGKWPYQLHYDLSTIAVYYNKDMFKAAGVPDPNDKLPDYWTFDDFRAAAVKLTGTGKGGKQWGLLGRLDLWSNVDPMMQANGGGLINVENTKSLLDKQESIDTMQQIVDLYVKDKVAPTAEEAKDIPLFESGRVAMQFANPEVSLRYRSRITDFAWDIAPLPVSTQTKVKKNWVHGGGLSMSSQTKQPEATWKFLNYYMSAENLAEMVGKPARGIPGRPSVKDTLLRPDQPPKNMKLFLDAVDWGVCTQQANFDEFNKLIGPAADDMYTGKRPVADVFKELTPKIDALIKPLAD